MQTPRSPRRKRPLIERFADKFTADPVTGCWVWHAACDSNGYGLIYGGRKRFDRRLAHRVSWELFRGSVPDGLFVCHRCDNPPCVNPEHLFLGTNLENQQDMVRKGKSSQHPRPNGDNHYRRKRRAA